MQIVDQKIGAAGEVKAELSGGALKLSASYSEGAIQSSLSVSVSSDVLVDQLEQKLSGQVAKEVLELIRVVLKTV